MVIYLTHFLHGAKVAVSDMEAALDEQNGWVRYNPDTPSEPEEAVNTLVVAKRKYTRKAADPSEVTTEGV
jgi:hypothetical protein